MTREFERTSDVRQAEGHRARPQCRAQSDEWVRSIPSELLEPHPLVKELRLALETKESTLAEKEREIARLHVALAFGIKRLPCDRSRPDTL